ncbi:SDR family NAD(P)-dependent oxidoreductase [Streptosporangium roseum]|uniref:SDR family NAD(P)-dependent oxidoreductase n=1 Tax=Streptosporangium roseum TaxID=2001 RepID=UPI003320C5E1
MDQTSGPRPADGRRVVIVTGAAGGIGTAITARLLADGFTVAAVDVNAEGLERLERRHGDASLTTFSFDLTTEAERCVGYIASMLGDLYGLVNNAAVIHIGDALATSDDDWSHVLASNLTAPFQLSRAILPHLLARGAGVIVNLASIGGVIGLRERAAYCAAKAGVLGLTRAMAADHGGSGVRINAVNPGTTETPMVKTVIDSSGDPAATREIWSSRQPVGRMGRPEEIAAAVAFLVGDHSGYMSGSTITVDGGFSVV